MAAYNAGAWGLSGAIDEQSGGTGATAFFFNGAAPFAFTRPEDKDRRTNLGGFVKFGQAKIGGGWLGRKVSAATATVKSNAYYLTGEYKLTQKITIDGGVNRMTNTDQDRSANLYVARGFYNLNPGLDAYLQIGHINNSARAAYSLSVGAGVAPPVGGSQTGTMAGLRYIF
jgi:hypothetical protein